MSEVSDEPSRANRARLVIDTGATHHCFADPAVFDELKALSGSREVRLGNSASLQAQGSGTVSLIIRQGDKLVEMKLRSALFVPGLNTNLLSVSQLSSEGYRIGFTKEGISISSGRVKVNAKIVNGLYVLDMKIPAKVNATEATPEESVSLKAAHDALAHIGIDKVKKTLSLQGIPFNDDFVECDACLRGKLHKQPSRSKPASARADRPGRLFADTCSATENSLTGKRHFLCITDDHTRFRSVFFLKQKSEVPQCI